MATRLRKASGRHASSADGRFWRRGGTGENRGVSTYASFMNEKLAQSGLSRFRVC